MARDAATTFHPAAAGDPLLRLDDVVVEYQASGASRRSAVRAVDGVTLDVLPGRSVGLVGESGCGKTSLGRAIVGLAPLSDGRISIAERTASFGTGAPGPASPGTGPAGVRAGRTRSMLRLARSVQMVFQDPYASLDPRQRIGSAIAEPMAIHGIGTDDERRDRVAGLLERVGLEPSFVSSYPHQLSGGQRQRVCIARALAVAPLLMVCDEPTSALDVSIQAQVVELLKELKVDEGLTYLFVTHDLALLPQLVDDLAVMYLGRIVESGPAHSVLRSPRHPYTVSLLEAVPVLGRRRTATTRRSLHGEANLDGDHAEGGCAFRPRCWLYRELDETARSRCRAEAPLPHTHSHDPVAGHLAACHHVDVRSGGNADNADAVADNVAAGATRTAITPTNTPTSVPTHQRRDRGAGSPQGRTTT